MASGEGSPTATELLVSNLRASFGLCKSLLSLRCHYDFGGVCLSLPSVSSSQQNYPLHQVGGRKEERNVCVLPLETELPGSGEEACRLGVWLPTWLKGYSGIREWGWYVLEEMKGPVSGPFEFRGLGMSGRMKGGEPAKTGDSVRPSQP